MNTRLFGLFLIVLLASFMQCEASICETRSQQFKGICFNNDNCATICEKEGFISGRCKGFIPKCICAKPCTTNGAPNAGSGPPADNPPESDGPPEADNPPETISLPNMSNENQ